MSIEAIREEALRRRTFAIISHPDAGKTTLTEKFLLYSGQLAEAGSVKAKRGGKSARSDWMTMEQDRGISVASTVLQFNYEGTIINLLDTPGHAAFKSMRIRGTNITDIVILVVDAVEGPLEQTIESLRAIRQSQCNMIVAINKIDRPDANVENTKKALKENGVQFEEMGL